MVTKEQFKNGIGMYIEKEFVDKLSGLRKWAIVLAGTEVMNRVDTIMASLPANKYITKDGMIDIDNLYKDARNVAETTGEVVENIPMIGDVRFSENDIDELYRYIIGRT